MLIPISIYTSIPLNPSSFILPVTLLNPLTLPRAIFHSYNLPPSSPNGTISASKSPEIEPNPPSTPP